jgi:ABC-type transport system substrate-binding protein
MPQISNDGKTYKLTLRPNMKYSDGTPIKAADFTYAIQRRLAIGAMANSGLKPDACAQERSGQRKIRTQRLRVARWRNGSATFAPAPHGRIDEACPSHG